MFSISVDGMCNRTLNHRVLCGMFQESELAMKCMHDTNFSKDDCSLYFKNYRNCMGFWVSDSMTLISHAEPS